MNTSAILTGIAATVIGTIIVALGVRWWAKRSVFVSRLPKAAALAKEAAREIARSMKPHWTVTVGATVLTGIVIGFSIRGPIEDYLDKREERRRVARSQEERWDLENRWEVTCGDKCLEDCEYRIERCARKAVDLASAPARRTTLVDLPQASRHFGSCLRENEIAVAGCPGPTKPCIALRQKFENSVLYVGLQKYNGGWQPDSATGRMCGNDSVKQGLSNSGTRQETPASNGD